MEYLAVRNWQKFQHYKTGSHPPWIKSYTKLLSDYEFNEMSEVNRGRLMRLWLLAAEMGNKIPNDRKFVARQIGATTIDLDYFLSRGFLEKLYEDSRETLDPTEQKRTEEKRAEQNGHYELPEHALAKLLSALTDKDTKTETSIRNVCKRRKLTESALAEAREAAMSKSATSPTRVAMSVLKSR
jgi:hypothetical protein